MSCFNPAVWLGVPMVFAGCASHNGPRVNGNGVIVSETPSVDSFHAIDISGAFEITLAQSDTSSVAIKGDENIVALVELFVSNDTLFARLPEGDFRPSVPLKVDLTTAEIVEIELSGATDLAMAPFPIDSLSLDVSGASNVDIESLQGRELTIDASGASDIDIVELVVDRVETDASGACSITLAGTADHQVVELSGASDYSAERLLSATAEVDVSGASSADLNVSESADVEARGASTVNIDGDATIDADVTGAASVR